MAHYLLFVSNQYGQLGYHKHINKIWNSIHNLNYFKYNNLENMGLDIMALNQYYVKVITF